jgi:serine/threonine protein kinase
LKFTQIQEMRKQSCDTLLASIRQNLQNLASIRQNLQNLPKGYLSKKMYNRFKRQYTSLEHRWNSIEQDYKNNRSFDENMMKDLNRQTGKMKEDLDKLMNLGQSLEQLKQDCLSQASSPGLEIKVGDQLGNYHIKKKLGAGSFGQVFRAYDKNNRREKVAVKILKTKEPRDVDDFCKEIFKMAVLCKHSNMSNIVSLKAFSHKNGDPYIVMEYMSKGTLHGKWHFSLEQKVKNAIGAARGLAKLHELDWVHLDVKNANLVLGADGQVKVIDMGLTNESGEKIKAGTLDYWAPEQGNREACSPKTDVYGLAITLLESLKNGQLIKRDIQSCPTKGIKPIGDYIGNHTTQYINEYVKQHHRSPTYEQVQYDLKWKYSTKKAYKWVILKQVLTTRGQERELYLWLSRALDQDPQKRPDMTAFAGKMQQIVFPQEQSSESWQDLPFYKMPDQNERREHYLRLDHEHRKQLLSKLTLGYHLDLYESLDNQQRIEMYHMLEYKQQKKLHLRLNTQPAPRFPQGPGPQQWPGMYPGQPHRQYGQYGRNPYLPVY